MVEGLDAPQSKIDPQRMAEVHGEDGSIYQSCTAGGEVFKPLIIGGGFSLHDPHHRLSTLPLDSAFAPPSKDASFPNQMDPFNNTNTYAEWFDVHRFMNSISATEVNNQAYDTTGSWVVCEQPEATADPSMGQLNTTGHGEHHCGLVRRLVS